MLSCQSRRCDARGFRGTPKVEMASVVTSSRRAGGAAEARGHERLRLFLSFAPLFFLPKVLWGNDGLRLCFSLSFFWPKVLWGNGDLDAQVDAPRLMEV